MSLIFLLDTSASAVGYVKELNDCLNRFKNEVSRDAPVRDMLDVAVIQFCDNINVLQNRAPVENMKPVRLITGRNAMFSPPIREALRLVRNDNRKNTYKPWVILITGARPSDDVFAVSYEIQDMQNAEKLRFIALGVENYSPTALKQLTSIVFRQDGNDFSAFFNWICKCMSVIVRTSPMEKPSLPPLEGNVYRDK